MVWGFMIFLVIFIAILFGGNYFIYISLVRFFSISDPQYKMWLVVGLFVCGVSFIIASILAHYAENIFTRAFYGISGLLLAIGWNVIIVCIIVWGIVLICHMFACGMNEKFVATSFLIVALVYSGYGIWCAFHPTVTHITLEVKDLPETWKDKTVVQLSDVHLGHTYGARFLTQVVTAVNKEHPDVVFITGDLFDGMDGALAELIDPLRHMTAPQGVYFITGNHETYLGLDMVTDTLAQTAIQTLDDAVVSVDGMQIVGVSYPERGEKKDIAETIHNMQDLDLNKPNILLYHDPSSARTAKDLGFDVQLAGHTHRGQLFPFQLITRAIYGRYANGLTREGDFSIYTSRGVGTWGPAMRTSGRPEITVIHFK